MLKEILTRAVLSKGKIDSKETVKIESKQAPSKLIGCWIINNHYLPIVENEELFLEGSYDIHLWYAISEDKDSTLEKKTIQYKTRVGFDEKINCNEVDFKVYCNEYPHCLNMEIVDGKALLNIVQKYSIDAIGETKFVVDVNEGFNEIKIDTEYIG